jgi:hypothetical protein
MKNPSLIGAGLVTASLPSLLLFLQVNLLFVIPLAVGLFVAALGIMDFSARNKDRIAALGVFLCIFAALGPFLFTSYLNRSGDPIRIVLPTDFQGHFSMKDDSPFYQWHALEVVEVSGKSRSLGDGSSGCADYGVEHDESELRQVVLGEFNDNPP